MRTLRLTLAGLFVITFSTHALAQDDPGAALPLVGKVVGEYKGELPCDDCRTIITDMELSYQSDTIGAYIIRDSYMGKGEKETLSMSRRQGSFKIYKDPAAKPARMLLWFEYDNQDKTFYYQLKDDGTLLPLDADKQPLDASKNWMLKKQEQ